MADILLFGPQAAGKTQLYHSLRGVEYNDPQQTGQEDYKVNKDNLLGWFGLSKYTIHEIGGKKLFNVSKEFFHQAFLSNSKLIFVFNGNEFIDELRNYKQGGEISALLRSYIMPALKENESDLDSPRDITFIATHEDEYNGEERDMETEIFSFMEKANEEYCKVANSTRYPFKKLMRGNLFCVDATDSAQVSEVFKKINKS